MWQGSAALARPFAERFSAMNTGPTYPRDAAHGALKQSDGDASNYGVVGFPLIAIEARPPAQRLDIGDLCSSTKVPGSMVPTG